MMDLDLNTHIFSLHVPNLISSLWMPGRVINLQHEALVHRISKVLRLEVEDVLVLFDQHQHAQVIIQKINKKEISILIESVQLNVVHKPDVTVLLPLLKKDALEESVYVLCELGINKIQLIVTQKSRQQLMNPKEFERLSSIIIAAAEQSKNYAMLQLLPVMPLSVALKVSSNACKLVLDPVGVSFFSLKPKLENQSVVLLVGPEGGLTDQEVQTVQQYNFQTCALTPTILKAVQAVTLGAGMLRLK